MNAPAAAAPGCGSGHSHRVQSGPRVALRPLGPEDGTALHRVLSDPGVCRYMPSRPLTSLAAAHEFIGLCRSYTAIGSLHTFAVVPVNAPSALCGIVQASRLAAEIEVGCALGQEQWGSRLMTEAMAALLAWAAERSPGQVAWAACDVQHDAARRMMEQLGFDVDRLLPQYRVHPALGPEPRDCVRYQQRLGSAKP